MRSTCLYLNALFEDRALHTIVVNIHHENLDAGIAQLQALAQGWQHSKLAKKLRILSLRPTYIPCLCCSAGHPKLKRKASTEKHVSRSTADLVRLLPLALATLKHLTSVEYEFHSCFDDHAPNIRPVYTCTTKTSLVLGRLSWIGSPACRNSTI